MPWILSLLFHFIVRQNNISLKSSFYLLPSPRAMCTVIRSLPFRVNASILHIPSKSTAQPNTLLTFLRTRSALSFTKWESGKDAHGRLGVCSLSANSSRWLNSGGPQEEPAGNRHRLYLHGPIGPHPRKIFYQKKKIYKWLIFVFMSLSLTNLADKHKQYPKIKKQVSYPWW